MTICTCEILKSVEILSSILLNRQLLSTLNSYYQFKCDEHLQITIKLMPKQNLLIQ